MYYKERSKPHQLQRWEILKARKEMDAAEKQYVASMRKGYEGECLFDERLKHLPENYLILNDLHFITDNHATLQIDSLVIIGNNILLFEIKHYEGDFYIEDDVWFTFDNQKITNPLHQLKRSESLLSKLLRHERYPFSVKPYLVFTHPEFVLFHAPRYEELLLPGQLSRFFRYLNNSAKPLHPSAYELAKYFLSKHQVNPQYQTTRAYDYDLLQKGVFCKVCSSPLTYLTRYFLHCPLCQKNIPAEEAIIQAIHEFSLLFPQEKITTSQICDWTGSILPKRRIQKILSEHYEQKGYAQKVHYVKK